MRCKLNKFNEFTSILSTGRLPILLRGKDNKTSQSVAVPSLQTYARVYPINPRKAPSPCLQPCTHVQGCQVRGLYPEGMIKSIF